jgi:hypothetical protein
MYTLDFALFYLGRSVFRELVTHLLLCKLCFQMFVLFRGPVDLGRNPVQNLSMSPDNIVRIEKSWLRRPR